MRKAFIHLVCIVLFLSSSAWGQSGRADQARLAHGLRLDGTFIQIQEGMLKLDAAAWQKELEAIKAARMETIILQFLERDGKRFFGEGSAAAEGGVDVVETVLDFADRNRMEVHLGLAVERAWWKQWSESSYLDELAGRSVKLADAIQERYGKHRSFAGWYIPTELWDGPYTAEQTANLRGFLRTISDHCKKLGGSRPKPVGIAPFCSGKSKPAEVEKLYAEMLTDSGVDIVMLQDGVGARGRDGDLLEIVPYFRAMRDACLSAGCELWSDLESFKLVARDDSRKTFEPADVERIGYQIAVEWPFVQKIVTFDFYHYMSPYRSEATKKLNGEYLDRYVKRNWLPALGKGPTIDPVFAYYHDRSPESIAAEIRANGYSIMHYVLSAESRFDPALLAALHREGIGAWYMTWGDGTYSTADLPAGWESWKMVTRSDLEGKPLNDGFTRLCLNHPEYRKWRKQQIARMMRRAPFQGVEIVEPHWPDYPGVESKAYACFCPQCLAAFRKMYPEEKALPDIIHKDSALSPGRNPELWKKWLAFRRASMTDFLNDLLNGPGGLRETVPEAMVSVWSLALKDGLQKVREDNGEDAGEIARVAKPDVYGLQTHWPDWIKGDLSPDYVNDYVPFIEQIRKADAKMPILIQADTGSQKQNRRSWEWIGDFERACWKLGVTSTTFYEYFIGLYMYTDPPRVAEMRRQDRQTVVVFTKRLDLSAGDPSHYELVKVGSNDAAGVSVVEAKVDGNMVTLTLNGVRPGRLYELKVKEISDAADRRLIQGQPQTTLKLQAVRFRY